MLGYEIFLNGMDGKGYSKGDHSSLKSTKLRDIFDEIGIEHLAYRL